jgi:hypothetical protein
MRQTMAQQDYRIPSRPGPTAPPPPRAFEQSQPGQHKPIRKQITRKSINKSQYRTIVIMVVLLVFFFIISYLATIIYSKEDSGTLEEGTSQYFYKFKIPDVLSQDVPVQIEVNANEPVEFYLLSDKDFNEDMDIVEIRNESINNDGIIKAKQFIYEDDLEQGRYVIVSYLRNNNNDIELDYSITRLIIMPVLWLISLIFILLIVLCIVWIFLLEKKKKMIPPHDQQHSNYSRGRPDGIYQPEQAYNEPNNYWSAHPQESSYDSMPAVQARPPHSRSRAAHGPGPIPSEPPPPPRTPRRRQPRAPGTYTDFDAYSSPAPLQKGGSSTITVPCKCGELIMITDPTRPLQIMCPRCGRRGVLEGKKRSVDDEIFY